MSAKRICELAAAGDEWAKRAVDRETYYLGLGMANLVIMFTPGAIVLGGSLMKSTNLFLDGVRKIIRQSCGFVPYEKTELTLASLGPDANLVGAARVWHHRFSSQETRMAADLSVIEGEYFQRSGLWRLQVANVLEMGVRRQR